MQDLSNKRENYTKNELLEIHVKDNPIEQFRDWYIEAENCLSISEANAMALSTVEKNNQPRTRMVLLKQYTWEGFIFYTNYNSRKGEAIKENPLVCLHFFWAAMERQVIIQAKVERLIDNLSDGYFDSRPLGSKIGAVISPQSSIIESREWLQEQYDIFESKNKNNEIKRPKNWGGYLAKPYQIEFWQGRPNRLHDRLIYTLEEDYSWSIKRLAP